ncbi:Hemicentin-1, partial [Araneus ventricosus]
VAGSDEHGYPIERMTSTAISAQLPDAPEVSTRPYMTGYYEEDTDLRCYVQSLVPFSVTWFKEGVQISQEQRFPQTSEVVLTVPEVTMLSEGLYSCNASNVAGRDSSVIFLDVKEPPPSIASTGNVSGILGQISVLPCVIDSVVDYQVEWKRLVPDDEKRGYLKAIQIPDDSRLIIHSNDSLVIKNLAPNDEGWYRCSASNEGGTVQENIYLHSYSPPKLSMKPPVKNFVSGSYVNITCEAVGYPEPSIRWIWSPVHNNNFVIGRSKIEGKSLIIQTALAEDEGRYDCIGTNVAGSQAASAFLNYIETPLISLPVQELTVKNGEQATLRCIAEGIPDPRVRWYKGSVEIQPLSYIQITSDGSLSIYDVQETDAGEYTCVAENEAGTANETMVLNVGSKPLLIRLPSSAAVEVLQNITIPCIATGTPTPAITWFFENRTVVALNSKTSVTPEGSLLIFRADPSVVGKYVCEAENKFGKEEQTVSIVLTGIKKPILSPLTPTVAIPRGEKRSIPCVVLDGNPKPDIIWLRNGNPIQNGLGIEIHEGRLEILRADEFHEANYTCFANNIGGNATEDIYVNVLYEPEISTSKNDFEAVEGSPVILPCEVKGDPKPAIIWFKNGIELISDRNFAIENDGSLKIINAVESDEGEYVCSATNIVGTSDQVFKLTVKVPPKPLQPDGLSYNVTEGDMITLPCSFYAKPPAQVHWTRITKQSLSTDLGKYVMYNGSLLLKPTFEDAGIYICTAKNEVGDAKTELSLSVFVIPYANIKAPNNVVASVGDKVELYCEVSGQPQPEISWKKDNVNLLPSSSIFINNGNLSIRPVDQFSEGEYKCIAENLVGISSSKVYLSVHETPRIVLEHSSPPFITAVVGDKLDLICNATGYPLPQISWKESKNFAVHHIENNVLHIPFIQESDAGLYTCTAQNVAGFDTKAFNLTVHAPPVFTSDSSLEHELISGKEILLDCSVSAEPPPKIEWYKDAELIKVVHPNILLKDDGQKLLVSNINVSDAGQYLCSAKNSVGETSKKFQLSVSEPPRFLTSRDKKISVLKNDTLKLDCSAEGFPEPVYLWRKNGQILSLLKPGLEFEDSKKILKMNHAQELDSGSYSCIAMNKVGSSSQEFEVSVLVPPQIQGNTFEEKEVMLHESTEFNCVVNGYPYPEIRWYKDGSEISLQRFEIVVSDDLQTLTILKPEITDAGNYSCKAINIVGEATKAVQLNILVPPHIEQQSVTETFRVKEGEDLHLNCEAHGTPPPKIVWLKNGQYVPLKLYQVNETILEIPHVGRKDAGRYVCVATNKVGSFEKDFNIVVLSPPKPENSPTLSRFSSARNGKKEIMENFPFVLICPFSGYPALQFTWMKEGQILNTAINPYLTTSEGGKRLEVKHARAEHAGKYTCIARNEAGESKKDFLVDILVPPSINSDLVTQMVVQENSSLVLDCSSFGNPSPSIMWLKDGTELEADENLILSSDSAQLEIPNIEAYHSGTYLCIATNVAGSAEKEFNVDVLFSPRMNSETEEFRARPTAYVNKPVTLECPMSGNPLPQIKWLKNGKEINLDEEPNIYIHSDGQRLSLMRAKNEDTGKYSCVAENDVGSEAYQFDLEILAAPTIDKKNIKNTYHVKEGDPLVIKCPVSGHPKPIITWLRDSDVIPLHSSPHIHFSDDFQQLHLKQASLKDAGKYSCIAGNEVGTAEQDFKIDVQVPPKLENLHDIPQNKSAVLNKPITISCPVSGIPPPLVKWLKDGKPLRAESNPNIMLSVNSRHLKIFRTQVSDAGTYTCKAVNDAGKIEKEFHLDVQVPPSMLETNSVLDYYSEDEDEIKNELKAAENDTLEIECYVDGKPKPIILWIKDGHLLNISNDSHYEVFHNGQVLQISQIKSSDAGHYTCVASNVAGTKEKSFMLDVLVPPKLKGSSFESQEVLPNRPTVIECLIDSNPPSTVTWYKDGKIINFSNHALLKVVEDGKVLQFLKTTPEDDGLYTCVAENSVGKTEKSFKVDVFVPPVIEDTDFKSDVLENEIFTMKCLSVGNPKPHVIWLKDGQVINEEVLKNMSIYLENDDTILQVQEAKKFHSGQYKCIASNAAGSVEKSFDVYVKVPPRVVNTSEPNKTVFVNQPIIMYCFVEAEPEASVTWVKDGIILNDILDPFIHILDDGQKLQILRTRDSDDGTYSCEVTNSVGNDSRSFVLNVLESLKSKEFQVVLGKSTRIDCEASGTPPPTVTWLKNGLPLTDEDHVQFINNNYALLFMYASENEAGEYTCIAVNNAGTVEQKFNLTILVPPTFDDLPQKENLSAVIGSSGKLHCSAHGYPPPDIAWYKDGNIITDDENMAIKNGVLEFSNLDLTHNGSYICEASNIAGKETKTFNVNINVPPKIQGGNEPAFLTSIAKSPLTMQCPVSGIPAPAVMWLKNGIPVTPGYSSNFQITNQGTVLTVLNSQRKDSGKYMCVATNSAGNTSRNFVLNVLEPPSINKGPSLIKTSVGSEAVFNCITDGYPPPEVSWMKEGSSLLLRNSPYMKLEEMSLFLSEVKLHDAGDYICIAANEAGSSTKDFKLHVSAPPQIKDSDYSQKVLSGDPVYLSCETSGHPPPLIIWHKDSVLIQDNEEMKVLPDGSLHFPSANASHTGTYKCLAENEAGSHEAIRNLFVLTLPKIVEDIPDTYEVIQAQPVVLQCSAEGFPSPTIAWEHNDVSIDLYNPRYKVFPSGDLHISLTQSSDIGTYTCIAKNEAGSAIKNIDLIVLVPPTVKINGPGSIVVIKGRNVALSCSAKGFPPLHINWQRNGVPITGASNSESSGKLYIENILPEDSGTYVCVAANSVGRDHKSIVVEVHVPPIITTLPKSQDISVGDTLSLTCEASGYPFPSITWLLNNTQVTGAVHSAFGRSRLLVENAGKEDEGTYICLAQNAAGERKAAAAVRVRTPPVIVDSSGVKSVKLKDTVILDCVVKGDPSPNIIWLKNGQRVELNHRVHLITNGSLFIYNSTDQDSGQYKCVASNDFGLAEQVAELIVRSKPKFIIEPHSSTAVEGNNVNLDCRVYGEPKPTVTWTKDSLPLQKNERVLILPNNTLKIVAVQISDEGIYACRANNSLGSAMAEADIIVQVNGKWSNWQEWEECSSSCGDGRQMRQRFCNDPTPRNGGKACIGISNEVKHCNEKPCPVNGEWGNWMDWTPCSLSCGVGTKKRFRMCDNPKPQFGGANCIGNETEIESCLLAKCPVDGSWSVWSHWQPCSATCGDGIQFRRRECNNPEPLHGGSFCFGESKEFQECNIAECPVHGEWGDWNEWSFCSSSCGGGTRERKRKCDSPAPAFGGHFCIGQHVQINYCNTAECPVNGEWGPWSAWGPCSSSCNKGQKKRFRSCDNPAPAGGGRECSGSSQETEVCNAHLCPVDGKWSEWSSWSTCSVTCGIGVRSRSRTCNNPDPFYGGKECPGDTEEFEECGDEACDVMPSEAVGHLIGVINGVDFGLSKLFANITQYGMEQTVSADIQNITPAIANWMKFLVPLLTPIYWTTAHEIGNAVNGYTLTKGFFRKETQVNFVTGEVLHMTHVARGLDRRGRLLVDIVVSGDVPDLPAESEVQLHPFTDINECESNPCLHICNNFPGGFSCQCLNGYTLDVDGESCIDVDECEMNLAHCTSSEECINSIGSYKCLIICREGYRRSDDELYCLDVNECEEDIHFCDQICINTIGSYSCECNTGYYLSSGTDCADVDECGSSDPPCSHTCVNAPGSFNCLCPEGYELINNTCLDIDECSLEIHKCTKDQECRNSPGGYECLIICSSGFSRSENGSCADVDECHNGVAACHFSQVCINTFGSYHCSCLRGYYSIGPGKPCQDINECEDKGKCQHDCENTPGSYHCTCPPGYQLGQSGKTCLDINECLESKIDCGPDRMCFNMRGSYDCIETPCPPKYDRDPLTGYCKLECEKAGTVCPPNARYAEVLAFKMVALPSGIQAYQDLIRLIAYDQDGVHVPNTVFSIIENDTGVPFRIRLEEGKGVLYTQKSMESNREYQIKVQAVSFNEDHVVQYTTKFLVFVSVSQYPY